MPERGGRRLGMEAEKVEVAANLAVVALLRLLEAPQILVQVLLAFPDRSVDPLQHRPLLVAPPVGGGRAEQLEGTDLPGGLQMRAPAEVVEGAVSVEADHLAGRQLADDLGLVVLTGHLLPGDGLVTADLAALERQVRGHLLAHLRLDRLEVGGGQGTGQIEVVVEAILDRWPDPQLGVRKELQDRRRHDVRGGVAHRVEAVVNARVEQLLRLGPDLALVDCHAAKRSGSPSGPRCPRPA